MKRPYEKDGTDRLNRRRFAVILVKPENPENIGLTARAMKNTGFEDLRLVGLPSLEPEASRTAIHCRSILDRARFFPTLEQATDDRHFVLAATARFRKTFSVVPLAKALETILRFPLETRVGLVFGNERTGLSSKELGAANSVFFIPQASAQPSYNLASAVLLTLFGLFSRSSGEIVAREPTPLPRKDQEDCIRLILRKLEAKDFIHPGNKDHVTEMVQDLFGRMALTEKDRRFLLALLDRAVD
jgi:TrmH family RNA methyltransferase